MIRILSQAHRRGGGVRGVSFEPPLAGRGPQINAAAAGVTGYFALNNEATKYPRIYHRFVIWSGIIS